MVGGTLNGFEQVQVADEDWKTMWPSLDVGYNFGIRLSRSQFILGDKMSALIYRVPKVKQTNCTGGVSFGLVSRSERHIP